MNAGRKKDLPVEMTRAFQDAIDNITAGVQAYVLENLHAQYRMVAVQLRMLLLDKDSARSFAGKRGRGKSLLEIVYGDSEKILLQSLLPEGGLDSADGFRAVGPPLYPDPRRIITEARAKDRLVTLRQWLAECPAYASDGAVRKTETILRDIADKEGAHSILGWGGKDWRFKEGVALSSRNPDDMTLEEIAALPYDVNWEQFIIGAGARLLYASMRRDGQTHNLFDTSRLDAIPQVTDASQFTLQQRA